jgi:hypothetical protein
MSKRRSSTPRLAVGPGKPRRQRPAPHRQGDRRAIRPEGALGPPGQEGRTRRLTRLSERASQAKPGSLTGSQTDAPEPVSRNKATSGRPGDHEDGPRLEFRSETQRFYRPERPASRRRPLTCGNAVTTQAQRPRLSFRRPCSPRPFPLPAAPPFPVAHTRRSAEPLLARFPRFRHSSRPTPRVHRVGQPARRPVTASHSGRR